MPTPEEQQALIQAFSSLFSNTPESQAARQAEAQQVADAASQGLNRDGSQMSEQQAWQHMIQGWASAPPAQLQAAQQAENARVQDAASMGYDRAGNLTPEAARQSALDARYGSGTSWLDPSLQYSPALLAQSAGSQAFADPAAIAAQQQAMALGGQYATSNLNFQSPAQQQALMGQWAAIQGGQGAPTFMGNAQQQQLMQSLLGVAAPSFKGDADQRAVLNQAMGLASNTGPGSLQFDTSGRQGEQYGNLQGIIAGGGANAIEMAQRAKARADSESWLRGQREADMADYAERGLTGSGMELLNLAADRQAAAGRNSMADLQTSADLEKRRLDAINSASGLATSMRGQTIDEQGLLNNRATAGLGAASSLVNNMRSSDIQEQLGLNQALQSQFTNAAGIAGQMRGQDYNERTYTDKRAIDALAAQTDLSSKMRDQQASEQIGNRNAQLNALSSLTSAANNARGQSAQEAQYRAGSADDFAQLNQAAINNAASANANYLQRAQQNYVNSKQDWAKLMATLGVDVSQGLMNFDAGENANASNNASTLGLANANQANNAAAQLRNATLGAIGTANQNDLANQLNANLIYPAMGAWTGDVVSTVGELGINQVTAGKGAGKGGGAGKPTWSPTSGYSTQLEGAPLSDTNTTWSGQSSFLPPNFDLSKLEEKR